MSEYGGLGKLLIGIGLAIAVLGGLLLLVGRIPGIHHLFDRIRSVTQRQLASHAEGELGFCHHHDVVGQRARHSVGQHTRFEQPAESETVDPRVVRDANQVLHT